MNHRFEKHYSREEARSMLPSIREWIAVLVQSRGRLAQLEEHLAASMSQGGDLGGESVHDWLHTLVRFQEVMQEFARRQILLKDLDRGLVDFPAILHGREVFLCWEAGEEDVEHWHELDGGFGGREPLG